MRATLLHNGRGSDGDERERCDAMPQRGARSALSARRWSIS